ncbi:hypothetical protein KVT40_002401 [Elsinoe batatas]|uniref:Uncharacterized protein n=1 Tax=Elsinoe batatas TaxID=2601811 RepID=A0A8K0PJR4_9PEZI|nr:hypothetical protein KVT40_002401 [Elsinoe batatas]
MRPSTLGIHCLLAVLAYGAAIDTSRTAAGLIARDQRYAEAEYNALNRRNAFPASDPLDGLSPEPLGDSSAHSLSKRKLPKTGGGDKTPDLSVDTKKANQASNTPANPADKTPNAPVDKNAPPLPGSNPKDQTTPPPSPGVGQPNGLPQGGPQQPFGQQNRDMGFPPSPPPSPGMSPMLAETALGTAASLAPTAGMMALAEQSHENTMETMNAQHNMQQGLAPDGTATPPPTSPTSGSSAAQMGATQGGTQSTPQGGAAGQQYR